MTMIYALPFAALCSGIIMILLLDLFSERRLSWVSTLLSVGTCVVTWVCQISFYMLSDKAFGGLATVDAFSFVLNTVILGSGVCALLLNSGNYGPQRIEGHAADLDVLTLLTLAGAMIMVSSTNLMMLFLGLELLSLSLYVLAGCARDERSSAEAAVKYFLFGSFSSAFFLFGIVFIYASTGSISLVGFSQPGMSASQPLLLIGLGLLIFGFAFKLSLVPFHVWAPDVYQGTPVSLVALMATVVKAAAFGALLRLVAGAYLGSTNLVLSNSLAALSVLSMTIGNILALKQKSVKRLLAYSSIAHAGYALMGAVVATSVGIEATLFYMFAYATMTIAAFGVVLIVTAGSPFQYDQDDISSLDGLGWRSPLLAFAFSLALLSLAGFPPLIGFFGKFYLFEAVIGSGRAWLAVIAALNSLIGIYYYFNLLVRMYFREPEATAATPGKTIPSQIAVTLATILLFACGLFIDQLRGVSRQAAISLAVKKPVLSNKY